MQRVLRIIRLGLYLGATVFGGVSVAYPIIRARAPELGPIDPEDVDGLYVLSVFLPGPSFMNLWGAVCARAAGFPGAVAGQVALLLPAFLLVLALPLTGNIPFVADRSAGALQGAIWATAGLLAATGMEALLKLRSRATRASVVAMLAALLLGVHPIALMIFVVAAGALLAYTRSRQGGGGAV